MLVPIRYESVRSVLSSASRISSFLPTKDKLLGTELLLLESTRRVIGDRYGKQMSSGDFDVVATGVNVSVSFLEGNGFFEDFDRDNDVSYYKVGRGKKGIDPKSGEEYAFERQENGFPFCVPRHLVSRGEMLQFTGLLLRKAVDELDNARNGVENAPLAGATVFVGNGDDAVSDLECLENQLRSAAEAKSPPDVFCVEGCDTADKLERVREIIRKNEKRMVRLKSPNSIGRMIENDFETELGFDIPTIILREGKVDEII